MCICVSREETDSLYMTAGDTLAELGPFYLCSPGSSLQLYLRSLYNPFPSFVLVSRSCHREPFSWNLSRFTLDFSSQHD
jgi:hypothetical protein